MRCVCHLEELLSIGHKFARSANTPVHNVRQLKRVLKEQSQQGPRLSQGGRLTLELEGKVQRERMVEQG